MKKIIIAFALLSSSFIVLDDILTKTGTNETAIRKSIIQAALALPEDKQMPIYSASDKDFFSAYKITRAIILNERAGIVKEMGAYFKSYYNSTQFKKDFADALKSYDPGEAPKDSAYWQNQYDTAYIRINNAYDSFKNTYDRDKIKSQANANMNNAQSAMDMAQKMLAEHPELAAKSGMTQEELLQKIQQAQGQLANGRVQANNTIDTSMTDSKVAETKAEAEKGYNQSLVNLKATLEESLKNVPIERQRYNEKVALYNKKSNYKTNLSAALQNFLSATDDIDFNAALKNNRNFVNPQYERKNNLWKACFRAGKDATDAARSFAQEWISELK